MRPLARYKNIIRGMKVRVPRLTSGETYIVRDIYEESKGVVTIDVGTTTSRGNVVASVDAEDCYPILSEGSMYSNLSRLNG